MKRISFVTLCNLFILCFLLSCSGFNHNINITLSESEHYYKILAHYNATQSHRVDECMNKYLSNADDMSFVNSRIDGDLAMNDGTKFYIEKKPGYLEIKFNKDENSTVSYNEIKRLGEGLKDAIK